MHIQEMPPSDSRPDLICGDGEKSKLSKVPKYALGYRFADDSPSDSRQDLKILFAAIERRANCRKCQNMRWGTGSLTTHQAIDDKILFAAIERKANCRGTWFAGDSPRSCQAESAKICVGVLGSLTTHQEVAKPGMLWDILLEAPGERLGAPGARTID